MKTNSKLSVALMAVLASGCGASTAKKSGATGAADQTAKTSPTTPPAGTVAQSTDPNVAKPGAATTVRDATTGGAAGADDLSKLVALGPSSLGLKVLAAFGPHMTTYTVQGKVMDYLVAFAGLFTGAISPDPYTIIPAQLESISYFMAVAGLSQVVSNDYAAAVAGGAQGTYSYNCTVLDDAKKMVTIIYPPSSDADVANIAALIVTSCTKDGVAATVRAIVQSYAFVLKTQT